MELSRQADYAVRAMVDVASLSTGVRARTSEIAQRQQIPESLLPRIVAALSRAGLVETFKGNDGGVALARPASQISLLEVVKAVDGPICLNRCTYEPSRCDRISFCSVHPVWQHLQEYLNEYLDNTKLLDLVQVRPLPESLDSGRIFLNKSDKLVRLEILNSRRSNG